MTVLAPSAVKILAVCDEVDSRLYGSHRGPAHLQAAPDLMISCGDLPAYYLDYLVSKLDVPLYAVHGNHDTPPRLD
jgi:predicted phosphodiesterase